jgi:hypothetical protein
MGHRISDARDYVRLHPDEAYWSPELCFVSVPIKGARRDSLHLITEDLALKHIPSGKLQRYRLALATKPHDAFFLCVIPTRNPDNEWNKTTLLACHRAKSKWVEVSSRREEGIDGYLMRLAHDDDAFPEPCWPTQSLSDLIGRAFHDRTIDRPDHPALLRLIGAKQVLG